LLARFLTDEGAATALEYALLMAGVSVLIGTAVHDVGGALIGTFLRVASGLDQKQIIVINDP
jgi:Flp pilus assembly pilin Flp